MKNEQPATFSVTDAPAWLRDAVFYEIYPQTFYDTNGDGIGDFAGITEKLPYIRSLGCNALWINPCFDSPFKDAGYDVRDYKRVAPRYGTNEDLYHLFEEAHRQGIRVILDLVPGHTSEEHPWFLKSGEETPNEYSGRYIWSDDWIKGIPGAPYIGGERPRNGTYMLNFFKCQPALNYGWLHPTEPWQCATDSPEALATREAMKDVMRFWLDRGADGFRVDMAGSLVKGDDDQKSGTCAIWRDIRTMLDREYPEAALVAEWSWPEQAIVSGGFHADFYLDHWDNGYHTLLRDGENSFFRRDGRGDIHRFLKDYLPRDATSRDHGYIAMITCNHDTPRVCPDLTPEEAKLAYAFLLTLPGVPFIYYGDEIGMRYQAGMPTKEGGYTRTGTRTPMQWAAGKNLGFSGADASLLYLPVDASPDAPTVAAQEGDPASLLETVRALVRFRHEHKDLAADTDFEAFEIPGEPHALVYRRGGLYLCVNPSGKAVPLPEAIAKKLSGRQCLFALGANRAGDASDILPPESFAIYGA